ncbi:periplasmic acid trehalase Ath1p [Trichomonascus vanleenenianus]|uniref:alpha,alpha-trehalase ATH1 n=1 Tax=Trichomonascus vanleenenianus TaxID=2268995 RepID=UPI003ECA9D0C
MELKLALAFVCAIGINTLCLVFIASSRVGSTDYHQYQDQSTDTDHRIANSESIMKTLTFPLLAWLGGTVLAQSPPLSSANSSSPGQNSTTVNGGLLDFLPAPPPPSQYNQTSNWVQAEDDKHNFYDEANWVLYTDQYQNNTFAVQAYSANGYIGIRMPVQGHGFTLDYNQTNPKNGTIPLNGWPEFNPRFTGAYVSGFWDSQKNTTKTNFPELLKRGHESIISTLPVWSTLVVRDLALGKAYNTSTEADEVSQFVQALSLKNGVVHTNLTWQPTGNVSYELNYTIVTHRARPNLGIVRLDITAGQDSEVDISDILDGAGSMRTTFLDSEMDYEPSIWTSVTPTGIRNVSAYEYSRLWFSDFSAVNLTARNASTLASTNASTISQQMPLRLQQKQTFTVIKYVGVTSTDAFPEDPLGAAKQATLNATSDGWDTLMQQHNSAWATLWDQADVIVPGDEEVQLSVRSTLFHLLANVRDGSEAPGFGDNSVTVGGLSSDSYAGLIFWDADLWMFHGLLALHPNHAGSINNYRDRLAAQAVRNAQSYNQSGALYPWTSGRFGNCTATGPCVDYEYHINTDIALAHWNYFLATNDTEWLRETGYPIIRHAADFFTNFVQKSNTSNQYTTHNMTDPDEYANHIDNGAFTNAAIEQLMKWVTNASLILGQDVNPQWTVLSQNMHIPEDANLDLTLEFDGMNGTAEIKQADVVLMTYPLEYDQPQARAVRNMDYYALRQSPDGPAMTYAIFAINEAQLTTEGCSAYTFMNFANQPYMRRPFYQFSEQMIDSAALNGGTNPAFPFLTGHGGYLQVFTHGFTGYRPRQDVFYLDPTLPPQLAPGYLVKGLKYQGGVFDVNITLDTTIITRRPDIVYSLKNGTTLRNSSSPMTVQIGDRNPKAGIYQLQVNETLEIPTYRPDMQVAYFGNLAQCKPVSTEDDWVSGNFPFAINDGDNSTHWQPLSVARTVITVDLGAMERFDAAYFLWGDIPPTKVSIGIPQGSQGANVSQAQGGSNTKWIVNDFPVSLSHPWSNATNSSIITFTPGNETMLTLNSTYQSRFVQIAIEGSYLNNTNGGRLAEFNLLNSLT